MNRQSVNRGPSESAEVSDVNNQPDIDINQLKALVGDNLDNHCLLLQKYTRSAFDAIQIIKAACEDRDATSIRQQAHKLKSSSGSIGANRLANDFKALEIAVETSRWHDVDFLVSRIDGLYHRVEAYIENYCGCKR